MKTYTLQLDPDCFTAIQKLVDLVSELENQEELAIIEIQGLLPPSERVHYPNRKRVVSNTIHQLSRNINLSYGNSSAGIEVRFA